MKKFIEEFKAFIKKGNVLDLAVGVVIGAAFGKIVTSLVNDILTPFIMLAVGKDSLKELSIVLRKAILAQDGTIIKPELLLNWGNFLQNIIDFLIIALVIFIIIRLIVKAKETTDKLSKATKNILHINKEEEQSDKQESAQEDAAQIVVEQPLKEPQANENELTSITTLLVEIRDALKKDD